MAADREHGDYIFEGGTDADEIADRRWAYGEIPSMDFHHAETPVTACRL